MPTFQKITSRDKPETLARTAAVNEEHLRLALAIALKRAVRSKPMVRALLNRATVEGLASLLDTKTSAVSFAVPECKQTWHQLYSWQSLKGANAGETAAWIASSLRENIRRNLGQETMDNRAP